MVKHILFIKRKPGLTRDEFSKHWREVHGPLVMGLPEVHRHFLHYVQNHLVEGSEHPNAAHVSGFDGIAEIVYASPQDRADMVQEPLYQELVVRDEERFIERATVVAYQVEQHVMKHVEP